MEEIMIFFGLDQLVVSWIFDNLQIEFQMLDFFFHWILWLSTFFAATEQSTEFSLIASSA